MTLLLFLFVLCSKTRWASSLTVVLLKSRNKAPINDSNKHPNFLQSSMCIFCSKTVFQVDKVRDHDHFTGKYEGVAHSKCNIKAHQIFKNKINIPVVFHNAN